MTIDKDLKKLSNATDNLIEQQFYQLGTDKIVGRTPEVSLKISHSGQIVKKFKELFNKNLKSFIKGDYLQFLESFTKIKGINEKSIKKIHDSLQDKLKTLDSTQIEVNKIVLYTIVLSSLISYIRDIHFENSIEKVIKRAKRKISSKTQSVEKKIHEELNKLFMYNNKNISILYNISYLNALAESFNYKKVARVCKIQEGKYINVIVDIIVKSLLVD